MAAFSRLRTLGAWLLGTVVPPSEWETIDARWPKIPNFAEGSTHTPTAPVIVGGAQGMQINTLQSSNLTGTITNFTNYPKLDVLTSTQVWNKPTGARWFDFLVVGGGASGAGGGTGGSFNGGGGGGSGYIYRWSGPASLFGATIGVDIGAGGAQVAQNTNGLDGGSTNVVSYESHNFSITAYGGRGGIVGSGTSNVGGAGHNGGGGGGSASGAGASGGRYGRAGSTSAGGTLGGDGALGTRAFTDSHGTFGFGLGAGSGGSVITQSGGGGGGGGFYPGVNAAAGGNGNTGNGGGGGNGYGAGGGGGGSYSSGTSAVGGAGAQGLVIVATYF